MTGVMKVAVPSLGEAFAGQLAGANIPFQDLNRWAVPFIEMAIGGALLSRSRYRTLLSLYSTDPFPDRPKGTPRPTRLCRRRS